MRPRDRAGNSQRSAAAAAAMESFLLWAQLTASTADALFARADYICWLTALRSGPVLVYCTMLWWNTAAIFGTQWPIGWKCGNIGATVKPSYMLESSEVRGLIWFICISCSFMFKVKSKVFRNNLKDKFTSKLKLSHSLLVAGKSGESELSSTAPLKVFKTTFTYTV